MAIEFNKKRLLGAGKFGEVWLAGDIGLGIDRAVKFVPRDRLADTTDFFREAQVLKSLEHTNVVRVEEAGETTDGELYIAMEFHENGSLHDLAAGAYLPMTEVKRLMIDALRGLEHAHEKSFLHRDIKPANIMLGDAREAKLSDFGLAVLIGTDPVTEAKNDYAYILHLAPEIFDSQPYSVASDIYAWGVTMYRLVNGQEYLTLPVDADLASEVIAGRYPNRLLYRQFVPRALRSLINKSMRLDPSDRFGSAQELRRTLEQTSILVDWVEESLARGSEWTAMVQGRQVRVSATRAAKGLWDVDIARETPSGGKRRIAANCATGLSKKEADQSTHKFMQAVVSTGKL